MKILFRSFLGVFIFLFSLFLMIMTGLADILLLKIDEMGQERQELPPLSSVSSSGESVIYDLPVETENQKRIGNEPSYDWRITGERYVLNGQEKGLIAIVIDDLGERKSAGFRAAKLPYPSTMSFLPYARHSLALSKRAHDSGHDVFVHLPMEPKDKSKNPGKMALRRDLEDDDITARTLWNLTRLDYTVGVNNHMGSSFTVWGHGLDIFFDEFQGRGLIFLDSLTNEGSKGWKMAEERGIPSIKRDVFLDHDPSVAAIRKSLEQLERIAQKRGYAVGIGHPYDETLAMLETWMQAAQEKGFVFVPISTLMLAKERGYFAGLQQTG